MKTLSKPFKMLVRFAILYAVFAFITCRQNPSRIDAYILKEDGTKLAIKLELAKTAKERAKGFMERNNIPEGTGMLFIFEKEERLSFWMKNTPSPLSIAYIDKHKQIKELHDMEAFSLEEVKSTYSCLYALEVPKGWFKKNGIKVGDTLLIDEKL